MDVSNRGRSDTSSRSEFDSHADTCVAGDNTVVYADTGERVRVSPFSGEYAAMTDVPIVTALTAWTDPKTGRTFILVLNQCLYFGDRLPNSLLNPNQLRANGLTVHDTPQQYDRNSTHSVMIPGTSPTTLPLRMRGVISYLDTRKPTQQERDTCVWLELTADVPWEPYSEEFADREEKATSSRSIAAAESWHLDPDDGDARVGEQYIERTIAAAQRIEHSGKLLEVSSADDQTLCDRLIACVNVHPRDSHGDGLYMAEEDDTLYPHSRETRAVAAILTKDRSGGITKEILARRWHIGLDTAHRTLQCTTQSGLRTVLHPIERRYRTRQSHLKFPTIRTKVYTDTAFSNTLSIRGFKCAQVYTTPIRFSKFYPVKSKSQAPETLMSFIHEVGCPSDLINDGALEECAGEMKKIIKTHHIRHRVTEPYSPWQNRAEGEIRELKKGIRLATRRRRSPKRLWCYAGEWVAAIRSLTAHVNPTISDRCPTEAMLGDTTDISEYAQFDWYQPVWYIDPAATFPDHKRKLGRWIGVAHDVGQAMTFWILPKSCRVIARSSVQAVSEDDLALIETQTELAELDLAIDAKIGDKVTDKNLPPDVPNPTPAVGDEDIFDGDAGEDIDPADPDATRPEADDYTPEALDEYLATDVILPHGGEAQRATVLRRKRNQDGDPVGKRNQNPILDT